MIDETSRYYGLDTGTMTMSNGRVVRYVQRRILPQGDTMPLLVEVTVTQDDRLDLIAARTLGEAEQAWRISDANNAMNPFDLLSKSGRVLRVPLPQARY
jgi:hypothetical protein